MYMYTFTKIHSCILYIAPSGHILTNQELQVLADLLAAHSDEKLKEIRLSIQEKQDIRRITREEVEGSLRQCGLISVADGLRESIEKGILPYFLEFFP